MAKSQIWKSPLVWNVQKCKNDLKKVNFQTAITFSFIGFQKNEFHNIDQAIKIYLFMMLDIVYGILNPRNKNEV